MHPTFKLKFVLCWHLCIRMKIDDSSPIPRIFFKSIIHNIHCGKCCVWMVRCLKDCFPCVNNFINLRHLEKLKHMKEFSSGLHFMFNEKGLDLVLWISRKYFAIYAEACFANFGDRVKHWITFNEPLQTAVHGYGIGIFAPGRSEHSSTEPYLTAHHQLLAHAAAVAVYKEKYKV